MVYSKPKYNSFYNIFIVVIFLISIIGCKDKIETNSSLEINTKPEIEEPMLYLGADLSYVNEIEDFGGYFNLDGKKIDPFKLFSDKGCNIVRVRLWHSPETGYSDLKDVMKTIQRAKSNDMNVLLDFHYSDFWADPQKQIIPKSWSHISDTQILADSVYYYTYSTLAKLFKEGLVPEMVQVGNETNSEILQQEATMNTSSINWDRNSKLLNSGLKAVSDFNQNKNTTIKKMLHIAQPENALTWFKNAMENGILDYDIIGISYYPKWSSYSMDELPNAIRSLSNNYGKEVIVVETAYPHSMTNFDSAGNIMGEDALLPNYPATPIGQLDYLIDLTKKTIEGGGIGVIYC